MMHTHRHFIFCQLDLQGHDVARKLLDGGITVAHAPRPLPRVHIDDCVDEIIHLASVTTIKLAPYKS